jgi:uncharacterized protein
MPANLPPQYKVLEENLRSASTDEERLHWLEEMMSEIPKHKGTEKLRAELKKKISQINKKLEGGGAKKRSAHWKVEREGCGQVFLVGGPNCGKSSLLGRLTGAEPKVGDYPFTTTLPQSGMVEYEDVQVQLVDMPALHEGFTEWWYFNLVRNADLVLLLLDLSTGECIEHLESCLRLLAQNKILPTTLPDGDWSALFEDGAVPAALDHEPGEGEAGRMYIPFVFVGAKADHPEAAGNLEVLRELFFRGSSGDAGEVPPWAAHDLLLCSTENGAGLEELKRLCFAGLRKIRVYCKIPGKPPDLAKPFVLPEGANVIEFAEYVHKDFVRNLAYARIWREGVLDGQRIGRRDRLEDRDIVELHEG